MAFFANVANTLCLCAVELILVEGKHFVREQDSKTKIREHDANSHLGGQGARPEAANVASTH